MLFHSSPEIFVASCCLFQIAQPESLIGNYCHKPAGCALFFLSQLTIVILSLHYSIPLTGGQYIRDVYVEGTGISNFLAIYYVVCDVMSKEQTKKVRGLSLFSETGLGMRRALFSWTVLRLRKRKKFVVKCPFLPEFKPFDVLPLSVRNN